MSSIKVRFAPSPTGYLHIGGARTALFNWLYARAHGGQMLLRIEDTDKERSTQDAIDAIIAGLTWLGIDWDGDTVFQSKRIERHQEVVAELLKKGAAYYCYASPEELEKMRDEARKKGLPPRYNGLWRDRDPKDATKGVEPVVRLKAPKTGETVIEDAAQGQVTFQNSELDDLVLQRSDGTPTYMLAVVVDDHDMGITHVIRAVDHLTNAARQKLIFDAMGWHVPEMAHVTLIHGPDGAKLSKRHGALGVEAYRAMGYLPAALRNYLVRLGWSHGDQEFFTTEELLQYFSFDNLGRSPARFDFVKLQNMNGHYIRNSEPKVLLDEIKKSLESLECEKFKRKWLSEEHWQRLLSLMPGLQERAKTLVELMDNANFLFHSGAVEYDEKAKNMLDEGNLALLAAIHPLLVQLKNWNQTEIEEVVRGFATSNELKLGKVAQPLRAALCGSLSSPGIFEVMQTLGQAECLDRLRHAHSTLGK